MSPSVQCLFVLGLMLNKIFVHVPACCHYSFSGFLLFPTVSCCENRAVSTHAKTHPDVHTTASNTQTPCVNRDCPLQTLRGKSDFMQDLCVLQCLSVKTHVSHLIFSAHLCLLSVLVSTVLEFFCSLFSSLVHLIFFFFLLFLSFPILLSSPPSYNKIPLAVCLPPFKLN